MMRSTSRAWFVCGVASVAAVVLAVILQLVFDLIPCPLCILQRYCYMAVAAMSFWRCARPSQAPVVGALLCALTGLAIALRHSWLLAHPALSCGIDPAQTLLNKLPWASWLPVLFRADGLCTDATQAWLGLAFPNWSAAAFALLTLALAGLARVAGRKG